MNDREPEVCDCNVIHPDILKKVSGEMPDEAEVYDLSDLFKLFGDSTRLSILLALERSEMCVCDISSLLGMSKSAVSHQLRPLKDAKLIRSRRDGKVVYYSLDDDHVNEILKVATAHIAEKKE
jgi:DNA-binding transcriptional ArsR family regulator